MPLRDMHPHATVRPPLTSSDHLIRYPGGDQCNSGIYGGTLGSNRWYSSIDDVHTFFVGALELDAFYEIDHEKLPPKSPIQLKAIRVVKVSIFLSF